MGLAVRTHIGDERIWPFSPIGTFRPVGIGASIHGRCLRCNPGDYVPTGCAIAMSRPATLCRGVLPFISPISEIAQNASAEMTSPPARVETACQRRDSPYPLKDDMAVAEERIHAAG